MRTTLALLLSFLITPLLMAQLPTFEIQGHRGSRGLLPENTIPAFLRAIDEGVHTIELDVVATKDYKIIVSHDPHFNPLITTDPNGKPLASEQKGNFYQMIYPQIKKYDVGLRGNPGFPEQQKMAVGIPLLSEVIKAVDTYTKQKKLPPVRWNIEIKSYEKNYGIYQPSVEKLSDLTMAVIAKHLNPKRVTVQSFDKNVLRYCHAQIEAGKHPQVELSVLLEVFESNEVETNLTKLGFKPQIWSPHFTQINPERVKELHEKNIRVVPWTINQLPDMQRIKDMGCDGLITDYPNLARQLK